MKRVLLGLSGVGSSGLLSLGSFSSAWSVKEAKAEPSCPSPPPVKSRLIFLGTGSSTGIPHPTCVFPQDVTTCGQDQKKECSVCKSAVATPPEMNKNYRNNPSVMIDWYNQEYDTHTYIQIDATKHFKESVVRWYPRHGIPRLDALILTHDHADAVFGLDDVRGAQVPGGPATPVYLAEATLATLRRRMPYLAPPPPAAAAGEGPAEGRPAGPEAPGEGGVPDGRCRRPRPLSTSPQQQAPAVAVAPAPQQQGKEAKEEVQRWVTNLAYRTVVPFVPFRPAPGLRVTPVPVMHGEDYISLGFVMEREQQGQEQINGLGPDEGKTLVYISDVSRVPARTLAYLRSLKSVDLLVVDALKAGDERHNTHFCEAEAAALAAALGARRTLLLGLSHSFDHAPHQARLASQRARGGLDIQLSHDGLAVDLDL